MAGGNKVIMIRCVTCKRMLKGVHFAKTTRLTMGGGRLECLGCKKLCESCNNRLSHEHFKVHNSTLCDTCLEKRAEAKQNVYYRYPGLRYNSSPFSTEKYRQIIADDSDRPDI